MKFAHIVPVGYSYIADTYNDMHLLLYHWALESKEYVDFMSRSKVYKILDNSQFELREEVDYDDVIRYAKRMKVQEVVAPDVMYNFKRTKELIEQFLPKVPKGMKIQGVVCGETFNDLYDCYVYLQRNELIDVVSFSKHGCSKASDLGHYGARQSVMKQLNFGFPDSKKKKEIHMLGVNGFQDFLTSNVRSIDGKFLAKLSYDDKHIDWDTSLDPSQLIGAMRVLQHLR